MIYQQQQNVGLFERLLEWSQIELQFTGLHIRIASENPPNFLAHQFTNDVQRRGLSQIVYIGLERQTQASNDRFLESGRLGLDLVDDPMRFVVIDLAGGSE